MSALDVDVDELVGLEFAVTLHCQHKGHPRSHDEHDPAVWDVHTLCPACGDRGHYALCESGRLAMRPPATLGCPRAGCGHVGYWDDVVVVCNAIPEATRGVTP